MNYTCSVCEKSVTPAAYQYCKKNEYPVMCHKHQQEYGLNAYHVISESEKEILKKEAAKEEIKSQQTENNRKKNIIVYIERFVTEILIKHDYGYCRALFQEIESAKKDGLLTPEQYNKYIEIYHANKDKKRLTNKQKSDIWHKEINTKIREKVKIIISKVDIEEIKHTRTSAFKEMESIINEYKHIEDDKEEYLNSYMYHLQEITGSYYYEDNEEIVFGYKM
jgi:hypothetical protein